MMLDIHNMSLFFRHKEHWIQMRTCKAPSTNTGIEEIHIDLDIIYNNT